MGLDVFGIFVDPQDMFFGKSELIQTQIFLSIWRAEFIFVQKILFQFFFFIHFIMIHQKIQCLLLYDVPMTVFITIPNWNCLIKLFLED